ncbi:MAG: drug/metabolite transporter (DMT)-like permease [Paraglaciecola sp.]|jgi:drug/metabolite transporter (DMT)-like permease
MPTTIRHWYGFWLSLTTAFLWGVLPVFIKLSLETMDAVTITWYRFCVAGIAVFFILWKRRMLPNLGSIGGNKTIWLIVATLFLVTNYVANVKGLEYLNPETTQVLMQLAPFLLMLGGIVFYGERFRNIEIIGALLLLVGLLLFFNNSLLGIFNTLDDFTLGILFVIFAAVMWAAYALMQKPLLRLLSAKQLTLLIYLLGVLVLSPFTEFSQVSRMTTLQFGALLFCCVNTIVGYGAFTEALNVWQASKVSAVIAIAPLFTFISMYFAVQLLPTHFSSSELDIWAYIGAGIVIFGSALTSLGKAIK